MNGVRAESSLALSASGRTLSMILLSLAAMLVVYVAAGSVLWLGALVALTVIVPLSLYLPVRWMVLLPFASVIWLGEAFHFDDRLALSPHVLLAALVIFSAAARGPMDLLAAAVRRKWMLAFIVLFVIAAVTGFLGEADPAVVKTDLAPLLYFIVAYLVAAARFRTLEDAAWIARALVVITALAVLKVLYLSAVVGATAGWFNDWQAMVETGPTLLDTRIILRGADLFWFVGAAVIIGHLQVTPGIAGKLRLLPVAAILGVGMLFSATRSNWLGFVAAFGAQALLAVRRGLVARKQLKRLGAALLLVALLVGIAETQPEFSLRGKLRARLEQRGQELALGIRMAEAAALLESVGWQAPLGRGLGSEYFYSDDLGGLVQSSWSHNGILYLYLKMGLAGVTAYLMLFCGALRVLWRAVWRSRDSREVAACLGLFGALVCTLVLSLAVNKIFAVSGALFCGLMLGTLLNLRPATPPSAGGA